MDMQKYHLEKLERALKKWKSHCHKCVWTLNTVLWMFPWSTTTQAQQKPGEILHVQPFLLVHWINICITCNVCSRAGSCTLTSGGLSAYGISHVCLQAVVWVRHPDWEVPGCFLGPHAWWMQVCGQVHGHSCLPHLQVQPLSMQPPSYHTIAILVLGWLSW